MSLLLEALKKAALEKQHREDNAEALKEAEEIPASLGDTIEQNDNIPPVQEAPIQKVANPESISTLDFEADFAAEDVDSAELTEFVAEEPSDDWLLDLDESSPESESGPQQTFSVESDLHEDSVTDLEFEPEFEQEHEPEQEQTFETLESEPDFTSSETEPDMPSFEVEIEDEPIQDPPAADPEQAREREAEALRLEQQRVRDAQKAEQQRLLEVQQAEQQRILEEKRREQELAAEEERARDAEAEQKRQDDAAEQEKQLLEIQNKEALDQLIASGKMIDKKGKRRYLFFYGIFIIAAVGILFAYYLVTNNANDLSVPIATYDSEPTELSVDEPQPTENMNFDPAVILENLDTEAITETISNTAGLNPETTENLLETVSEVLETTQGLSELNTDNLAMAGQLGNIANDLAARSGLVEEASSTSNSIAAQTEMQSASNQQPLYEMAQRVEPAPNTSAYMQPQVLTPTGRVQAESFTERVIIHHKPEPKAINESIRLAYSALKANQLEKADRLYRDVLSQEPNQRDALLGAAATATALGNYDEAITLYQQRLQSDPADTYAKTGLLGLASDASSRQSVQREINELLQEHPESAHLHFLKGVGFATAALWTDAQSAFYDAYRRDNENPDYAFNLAVSLDHMRQPKLALIYYERAMSLAQTRTPNFDQVAAQTRLAELRAP